MLVLNLYFMHLQEGLVPLCNHLYVTKGAILYGAVSDVSALHAFMCKEMLDLRKKASFFQGIGPNPLFAREEQVDRRSNNSKS